MLREVLYFEDVLYRLESLMVYNHIQNDEVMQALKEVSEIISYDPKLTGVNSKYYSFATKLLAKGEELGLSGHLLRQYVIYLYLNDQNHLSLACESGIDVRNSTLYSMALKDMGVLQYFMDFDLQNLCENVGYGEKIYDYTPTKLHEHPEIDLLNTCKSASELLDQFIWHYSRIGCGQFGELSMFRISDAGELVGIRNHETVSFYNIYGYKRQKEAIKANTEAFLNGKSANSLLLSGSRGAGRYACLCALAAQYFDRDLRVIEVGKSTYKYLDDIISELYYRNKKFIIMVDGLTAADVEENYDHLKICLGLSLEMRPKNVLFYAVSGDDMPATVYFDQTIKFDEMTVQEYQDLVVEIAESKRVGVPKDFLKEQALAWAEGKHERSARTAMEFIKQVIWELAQQ